MKKTLVIGASTNPARYSNLVIQMLKEKKHPIVALGVKEGMVEDVPITSEKKMFSDIENKEAPFKIKISAAEIANQISYKRGEYGCYGHPFIHDFPFRKQPKGIEP